MWEAEPLHCDTEPTYINMQAECPKNISLLAKSYGMDHQLPDWDLNTGTLSLEASACLTELIRPGIKINF